MCLQETGVDPALFLADVQLRCCWIFYFFFNPVMFLPGIFYRDCLFLLVVLGLGYPIIFLFFSSGLHIFPWVIL